MSNARLELCKISGPLQDLLQKLSGDHGNLYLGALKKMLRGENPWITLDNIPVWKTIKLGTHPDAQSLIADLGKKFWKDEGVEEMYGTFVFDVARTETEVDLVLVSGTILGFGDRVTKKAVIERALQIGLELCPLEVGPQLRRQYTGQGEKVNDIITIGSAPFERKGGSGNTVIQLRNEGNFGGERVGAYSDYGYDAEPDNLFVFIKPRK